MAQSKGSERNVAGNRRGCCKTWGCCKGFSGLEILGHGELDQITYGY